MEDQKEKIKFRIKSLLKLSESSHSKEEAESAILKAQMLLLKYKIEMHEIDADAEANLKIIRVSAEQPSNTPWARQLASLIAKNFRCMHYLTGNSKNHSPVFFGEEDDAEIACSMYDHVVVWLNKKACAYATKMRNERGVVKGVKQDFILGFLKGLKDKFQAQLDADAKYALVAVVPEQVKKEYQGLGLQKANFSNNITTHGSVEARSAGYAEGRSFQNTAITN